MKKIFYIDSAVNFGGGQKVILGLINGFQELVDITLLAPKGKLTEICRERFPKIKIINLPRTFFFKKILEIRKAILSEKPDIIHLHGTRSAFLGRIAVIGIKRNKKVIYTLHGFHLPRKRILFKPVLLLGERILNRWTDVLVCVSKADELLVRKYNLIDSKKIVVIPNGIKSFSKDLRKINQKVTKIRRKLGINDQDTVLLYLGRIDPPKDVVTIIEALQILNREGYNNIKLVIVGEGSQKRFLERKYNFLRNLLFWEGFQKETMPYLFLADIVVLSSQWEGCPLSLLEAGLARKPVIGADVDGIKEVIIDGKNGFLFKMGSAQDLAEKIKILAKTPSLRKNMGAMNFKLVSSRFSYPKMIENYRRLYLN